MEKTLILFITILVLVGGFLMLAVPETLAAPNPGGAPGAPPAGGGAITNPITGSGVTPLDVEDTVKGALERFTDILVIIAIAMAVIALIWGAVAYMLAGGDPEKAKAARSIIFNGIIGAIVLFSISFIIGLAAGVPANVLKSN